MTRTFSSIYYNIIAPIAYLTKLIGGAVFGACVLIKLMQVAGPFLERVMG
jgi:hypothetical protein